MERVLRRMVPIEPEPGTPPTKSLNDLPPELLEAVIDRLGDRRSILVSRLIKKTWRSAANSCLERRVLSSWKDFETFTKSKNPKENPFPVMPFVPLSYNRHADNKGLNFAFCPAGLTKTGGNPFPSKSLNISHRSQEQWKFNNTNPVTWVKVDKFLSRFGTNLTSFHLEGAKLTGTQLNLIMKHLDKLQALTFSHVGWKREFPTESRDISPITLAPPQNLKYVRLSVSTECYLIAQWLVNPLGSQLIRLELLGYSSPVQPFRFVNGEFTTLFMDFPSKTFLLQTTPLLINCLSVNVCLYNPEDVEKVILSDLISFLDRFAPSLVRLHLGYSLFDYGKEELQSDMGTALPPPVPYPFMKELELHVMDEFSCGDDEEQFLKLVEQALLSRFPNLESLRLLVEFRRRDDGREMYIGSRLDPPHYFQACRSLQKLTLSYGNGDSLQPRREMKYTRSILQ